MMPEARSVNRSRICYIAWQGQCGQGLRKSVPVNSALRMIYRSSSSCPPQWETTPKMRIIETIFGLKKSVALIYVQPGIISVSCTTRTRKVAGGRIKKGNHFVLSQSTQKQTMIWIYGGVLSRV